MESKTNTNYVSQQIRASNGELLTVRLGTKADLPSIMEASREVDWNMGEHNFSLQLETCARGWEIVQNESGRVVAFHIINYLSDKSSYACLLLVIQEYRGLGVSHMFQNKPWLSSEPCLSSVTPDTILCYPNKFKIWLHKKVCHIGKIDPVQVHRAQSERAFTQKAAESAFELCELSEANVNDVFSYDLGVLGVDRRGYMRRWLLEQFEPERSYRLSSTLLIYDRNSKLCGFGCLRYFHEQFSLQPIYADNDIVAFMLLQALLSTLKAPCCVFMTTMANNRMMHEFENMYETLKRKEPEVMCGNNERARAVMQRIDVNKVYCCHELYPV